MDTASLLPLSWGVPGHWEILVVLLIIILLFGAKRLPELARSLGRSISEFRKGREEGSSRLDEGASSDDKPDAST